MTIIDGSTDARDFAKAERREIKAVNGEFDQSQEDEARQISAYNALTELKRIRNKQRKI
jgi:hypothetical protein